MAGDSQASFSQSVRDKIRGIYGYRCVICLNWLSTTQCTHVLDAATPVRYAVKLGVLPEDYKRNAYMVQCLNCRSLFTKNYIVLSLPIPVLKYLEQYVISTPKVDQKPLHEVFDLLVDALHGIKVELPNLESIIPYIGLFTLVTINPTGAARDSIPTTHLPSLSIRRGSKFIAAPAKTSSTAQNAARIFDPLKINVDTPGVIPISPDDEEFEVKRYWRLPVSAAAIFAALIPRLPSDSSDSEDIRLVNRIVARLMLKHYARTDDDAGSSGGGPSGDGGRQSKKKGASDESSGRGQKKARYVAVGDGAEDCGESNDANGVIDTDVDNSDSKTDRSISAIDPPDEWRFGPSFSTNKIVFAARAVNLAC